MTHRQRPTLRLGDRQPDVVSKFFGPMPKICARIMEFVYTFGDPPLHQTSIDDVPKELLDWEAIKLLHERDWLIVESGGSFWLTHSGLEALHDHALLSQVMANESLPKRSATSPRLTRRQMECLTALKELRATSLKTRASARKVATRALGPSSDPNSVKAPLADLTRIGLADAHVGRGGGSWITAAGMDALERNGSNRS